MIKNLIIISTILLAICTAIVVSPNRTVFAVDPYSVACTAAKQSNPTQAKNSPACQSQTTSNPITGSDGIIMKAVNILAIISGFAAVIVIIISGFQYILSGGDSAKVAKAKDSLIFAIIGLIIIIAAKFIIGFILSKL